MAAVTLREYQDDCIKGIRDSFIRGNSKVAAVLPTGSGKTTIFGSICRGFLDKTTGERVVIVSHLGLLTVQTGDRFQEEWDISVGVLQANRYPQESKRCIVTTMQSFCSRDKIKSWVERYSYRSSDIDRLKVTLLIVDEMHRMGSDSYNEILDMFPNARVIGFTATPFRQNKLMTDQFDEVAYTISIQELIDQKYLVPPVIHLTPFDTTDQADMFVKMANIYKEKYEGKNIVIYLKTIAEATLCAQIFVDLGISAQPVTSKLKGKKRDEILKEYKQGKGYNVLTTVDVLTAGFDAPNIRAIIMPYKVGSVTTYLQRIGRGLRPYGDKTCCDIYVGSNSPNISEGFWEKINKQMLMQGQRHTNLLDVLEFGENDYSVEEYAWTKAVVSMAKDARKRGLDGLFDMIVTGKLPRPLLDQLVSTPIYKTNSKKPATPSQIAVLKNANINAIGLTKDTASSLILNHKMSQGYKPPSDELVPEGRYEGRHFQQVPWAYLSRQKYGGKIRTAHDNYRRKVNGYLN